MLKNGVALKAIYLFGSTARKDDKISSDIDICLIGPHELSQEDREFINDTTGDIYVESCIAINWVYFSMREWNEGILPLIQTIKREGKLLWEKGRTE